MPGVGAYPARAGSPLEPRRAGRTAHAWQRSALVADPGEPRPVLRVVCARQGAGRDEPIDNVFSLVHDPFWRGAVSPDEKQERLERFEALCRERGLALTIQRRRILEFILDRKDHPTADQIFEGTRKHLPDVSRTTVYRVVDTLVDVGVIAKAWLRGAATRFDPVTDRHHHCVCTRCEKLIDVDDGQFARRMDLPDAGALAFEVHDFCVQFFGICAACRRSMGRRGAARAQAGKPARGKAAGGRRIGQRRSRRTKG